MQLKSDKNIRSEREREREREREGTSRAPCGSEKSIWKFKESMEEMSFREAVYKDTKTMYGWSKLKMYGLVSSLE
jgi:hypothetical protein